MAGCTSASHWGINVVSERLFIAKLIYTLRASFANVLL